MTTGTASPQSALTLADDVFNRLRTAIIKGELTPGAKINEPRLSRQYGISHGPLREAIRRLEGCKLVEIKPNAGASIVSLDTSQLVEIYEIRESLEGLACRLAAANAGPDDCLRLRDLLSRHEEQFQSERHRGYYQREGDLDFHYLVVQLSGNRRLFEILCGELYHLLRLYRVQSASEPSRPAQAFREHHRIVDAIADKDPELAGLLMRRHIAGAKSALLQQFNPD